MSIFAYADETAFIRDSSTGERSLGCAIFVTEKEIIGEVVSEAMETLRHQEPTDLRIKESIIKTLNKGQFHASKDSNYAKRSFLSAINKHIQGTLCVTYYDNPIVNTVKDQETFFARCMSSSSLELFRSMDEINLVIEKRESLAQVHAEKWKEQVYRQFESSSFEIPSFKTFYPCFNISLGDKSIPGLQVVDFLLWAVNRSRQIPAKTDWINQLRFAVRYHTSDDSKHNFGHYYLNTTGLQPAPEYPVQFKKSETSEDVIYAWIVIERFFWMLEETDFSASSIHLYTGFAKIRRTLKTPTYYLKENDLIDVGRAFIRLFDSLPLYSHISDDDVDSWTLLHYTKHIASLIITKGHIHTGRTRGHILRWRYEAQKNNQLENLIVP